MLHSFPSLSLASSYYKYSLISDLNLISIFDSFVSFSLFACLCIYVCLFAYCRFVYDQMPSSSANEIIKKCHDVGEKLSAHHHNHNAASNNKPVHYLHELPHAAEERYEELFKQLDRNGECN